MLNSRVPISFFCQIRNHFFCVPSTEKCKVAQKIDSNKLSRAKFTANTVFTHSKCECRYDLLRLRYYVFVKFHISIIEHVCNDTDEIIQLAFEFFDSCSYIFIRSEHLSDSVILTIFIFKFSFKFTD